MNAKYAVGQQVTIPWGRNGAATAATISDVRRGRPYRSALGEIVEYYATPAGELIGKWVPSQYINL